MNFPRTLTPPKPGTILAFAAIVVALLAVSLAPGAGSAGASGGIGPGGSTGGSSEGKSGEAKYDRLWDKVSNRDKRWASTTAQCESGKDPKAIGGGGAYRGAFMFLRTSWKNSPKSPGGDPIDYKYTTQAVVAVHLKKQMGTSPWPVCGR